MNLRSSRDDATVGKRPVSCQSVVIARACQAQEGGRVPPAWELDQPLHHHPSIHNRKKFFFFFFSFFVPAKTLSSFLLSCPYPFPPFRPFSVSPPSLLPLYLPSSTLSPFSTAESNSLALDLLLSLPLSLAHPFLTPLSLSFISSSSWTTRRAILSRGWPKSRALPCPWALHPTRTGRSAANVCLFLLRTMRPRHLLLDLRLIWAPANVTRLPKTESACVDLQTPKEFQNIEACRGRRFQRLGLRNSSTKRKLRTWAYSTARNRCIFFRFRSSFKPARPPFGVFATKKINPFSSKIAGGKGI